MTAEEMQARVAALGLSLAGRRAMAAGNLDEAAACYIKAVAAFGDWLPAYFDLGIVLQEMGRLAESADILQDGLRRLHAGARDRMVQLSGREIPLELSASDMEKMARNTLGNTFKTEAENRKAAGDEQGWEKYAALAVAEFERAIEIDPEYATPYNGLGNIAGLRMDLERALNPAYSRCRRDDTSARWVNVG